MAPDGEDQSGSAGEPTAAAAVPAQEQAAEAGVLYDASVQAATRRRQWWQDKAQDQQADQGLLPSEVDHAGDCSVELEH